MKKKVILSLLILTAVLILTLAACSPKESPAPTETPVNLSFDKIDYEIGGVYIVRENGMFYLADEAKGIFSKGFYLKELFIGYENIPDCLSVKLSSGGSIGFMNLNGSFLTPLNEKGTDFVYESYDEMFKTETVDEDDKKYVSFFLCNSISKKGRMVNSKTFQLVGDTYKITDPILLGDAQAGYVYLSKVEYNLTEKKYETKSFVVSSKTGTSILEYTPLETNINQTNNDDFGIENKSITSFKHIIPATETTEEIVNCTLFSNKNAEIIAENVKNVYFLTHLNTVFFGYKKDWISEENQFSKIYYIDKNMNPVEFSTDIYYSKTVEDIVANTTTVYTMKSCYYSTGLFMYEKAFTDNSNPSNNKRELYVSMLGSESSTVIDIKDGSSQNNTGFDIDYFTVTKTLVNPEGGESSFRLYAFADNSVSPILDYTKPFSTVEKTYSIEFSINQFGEDNALSVSEIYLYENRYLESEKITGILYMKKPDSPIVSRAIPKDANMEYCYMEDKEKLLIELLETETTHGTDRTDRQAAIWLPYEGDFNNEWHRSISLSFGYGMAFAVITDYTNVSIVTLEDNDSIKAANSIAPKLKENSFDEIDINHVTVYVRAIQNDFLCSGFAFSKDENGYFIPYPAVNVAISAEGAAPFRYNALIYGEREESGFFKEKIFEIPDSIYGRTNINSVIYNKVSSDASIKLYITEKEGGGLKFTRTESELSYRRQIDENENYYNVLRDKNTRLYGIETADGKTILEPKYDDIESQIIFDEEKFHVYLLVNKNELYGMYKIENGAAIKILDLKYLYANVYNSYIYAIASNGNSLIFDLEGNFKGEYDFAWEFNEDKYFLFYNAEIFSNEIESVRFLYEMDMISEKYSKDGQKNTYVILYHEFYIVKTGENYSAYGDFCFESFDGIKFVDSYLTKEQTDKKQFNSTFAFLRNGKYTPVTKHYDGSKLINKRYMTDGEYSEDDEFMLYYDRLNTHTIEIVPK